MENCRFGNLHIYIKNQQGFSLIEILISLFLFSFVSLAIMSMCITSIKGNATSQHSIEATLLAQDKLEELKGVSTIALLASGSEADLQTPGSNYRYNRSWTVSAGPSSSSRLLVVTVSWPAGEGSKQVTVQTVTRGNGT